jgi:hypothetical protein
VTLAGARAADDPCAADVAQILISGILRHPPAGLFACRPAVRPMPARIAAVADDVTSCLGGKSSQITS